MLSTFWQVWVTVIVVGSMIGCGLLIQFTSRGMKKEETTENTGHEYDGIVELDNPMPRWWVIMFWGTIVFGFIYLGVYGLGNFKGLLKLEVNGEQVKLRSRTFIPAKLSDNPDLIERDDYRATLAALPEPYRSAFKEGDFGAGIQDHEWQVIPTEWVLKAQQRWEIRRAFPRGPMTAMGVDIAQGGPDKTVLSPLYTTFFGELIREKGTNTKNGADVAALVIRHVTDGATINVDCGGG